MTLSDEQFQEWKKAFDPSTQVRVPRGRFTGLSGLSEDLGIGGMDPERASETIANAVPWAEAYSEDVDMPIGHLSAQHHIDRSRARKVFESIKARGFDPSERIVVTGDAPEWGGTIIQGHHRTVAARAAGMKTIPATFIPTHAMESAIETNLAYQEDDD